MKKTHKPANLAENLQDDHKIKKKIKNSLKTYANCSSGKEELPQENVHRNRAYWVEKLDFGATLQTNIRDAFRGVRRNREVVQRELCDTELERAVSHEAEAELRRTNAEERATPEFRALVSERTRPAMADVGVRERLSAAQQNTSSMRERVPYTKTNLT